MSRPQETSGFGPNLPVIETLDSVLNVFAHPVHQYNRTYEYIDYFLG